MTPKDIVFLTCKQRSNSQRYPFCKDIRMHWKKKDEITKLEEEIKTLNKETLDVEASGGGKEKKGKQNEISIQRFKEDNNSERIRQA